MVKILLKRVVLVVCAVLMSFSFSYAQIPKEKQSSGGMGPRKQLATIIFSGLGGAVLGLSTLSFYGRPQDKLSNIAVGFAIGIIVGTVYTTYKAATKPYIPEDSLDPFSRLNLYEPDPLAQDLAYKEIPSQPVSSLGYQWTF